MSLHYSDYKFQYSPQSAIAQVGSMVQMCAVPLDSALRFRQVWAVSWGSYSLSTQYYLQFWQGVLMNWGANKPFSPMGKLILEFPLVEVDYSRKKQLSLDGREFAGNQSNPIGWHVEFATSANGVRSGHKNFDLNIEADFACITALAGITATTEAFLGVLSSNFPAFPYQEQNFAPIFI